MSEFLIRGYNVAAPEVDRGDDLFVVRDSNGELSRIQVKTANAMRRTYGFSAEFLARYDRLERRSEPDMTFAFVIRQDQRWADIFVVRRATLFDLHVLDQVGTRTNNNVKFYFKLTDDGVTCHDHDMAEFRNNWADWPLIRHQ